MKYLPIFLLVLTGNPAIAQDTVKSGYAIQSPLTIFSGEWDNKIYTSCNTAEHAPYLSSTEKEIIYILNLARAYPKLFAKTVLAKYPAYAGDEELTRNQYYYQSLITKMQNMEALPPLQPDKACFESAACHATESGLAGYTGHIRKSSVCKSKQHFLGECCDYGNAKPVDIIITLLIDQDIPSFGHRKIILGNYSLVGVSTQDHKTYRQNTVIDFYK